MREDILERGEDPALFPILNSKPELFRDLHWIWEAYMSLSASRQAGMAGPQPISITEVLSYCEFQGITNPDDREELLHHVHLMDRIFMADFRAKQPKSNKGQPPARLGQP